MQYKCILVWLWPGKNGADKIPLENKIIQNWEGSDLTGKYYLIEVGKEKNS
jgi:hypothetical protein